MGASKFSQIVWRQAALDHVQAGFAAGRRHPDHSNDSDRHDGSSARHKRWAHEDDAVKSAGCRVRRPVSLDGPGWLAANPAAAVPPEARFPMLRDENWLSTARFC